MIKLNQNHTNTHKIQAKRAMLIKNYFMKREMKLKHTQKTEQTELFTIFWQFYKWTKPKSWSNFSLNVSITWLVRLYSFSFHLMDNINVRIHLEIRSHKKAFSKCVKLNWLKRINRKMPSDQFENERWEASNWNHEKFTVSAK